MKKIDKVMLNEKIKTNEVKEYIIYRFCPVHFGLKNLGNCEFKCEECWKREVDE